MLNAHQMTPVLAGSM